MDATQREIDLAQSDLRDFSRTIQNFSLAWCYPDNGNIPIPVLDDAKDVLCTDITFLQSEASKNNDLFSFSPFFEENFSPNINNFTIDDIIPNGWKFVEPKEIFDLLKKETSIDIYMNPLISARIAGQEAQLLAKSRETLVASGFHAQMIADYDHSRLLYRELIDNFQNLQSSWEKVIDKRQYLLLRIFSLSLLALVFPLRIGKSIFEIKK